MAPERTAGAGHHPTIHALRGVAALAVCWFHLTYGMPNFLNPGPLHESGMYGWLGVQVFFVISGYLIPFTLFRSGYEVRDFGNFLVKRLTRLEPPYFCTIAIIVLYRNLQALFPFPHSESLVIHWPQLLAHFGYLNVFMGYEWLVAVFWTLAVEFQFYLLLGIAFPLIAVRHRWLGWLVCPLLASIAFRAPDQNFLLHHLPVFCCGIAAFRFTCVRNSKWELMFASAFSAWACYHTNGTHATAVSVATAALILFTRYSNRVLDFWGDISYSFYLLHVPVGGAIVYVGLHQYPAISKPALLCAAFTGAVAASYLLYRLVEIPSKAIASRLPYRRRTEPVLELGLSTGIPAPSMAAGD